MARRLDPGQLHIQEAVALLIHNQAAFVTQKAETDKRIAELEARIEQRFANIERDLAKIFRILEGLPEAIRLIRQKIGFKAE